MRHDRGIELDRVRKLPKTPAQKANHIVLLAGIDDVFLVIGSNEQCAVALPDVDKHDLEQPGVLGFCFSDSAFAPANPGVEEVAVLAEDR